LLVGFAGVEHGHDVEGGRVGDAAACMRYNAQIVEASGWPLPPRTRIFRPGTRASLGQKSGTQLGYVVEDAAVLKFFRPVLMRRGRR
jgi:hypothetical protein